MTRQAADAAQCVSRPYVYLVPIQPFSWSCLHAKFTGVWCNYIMRLCAEKSAPAGVVSVEFNEIARGVYEVDERQLVGSREEEGSGC